MEATQTGQWWFTENRLYRVASSIYTDKVMFIEELLSNTASLEDSAGTEHGF